MKEPRTDPRGREAGAAERLMMATVLKPLASVEMTPGTRGSMAPGSAMPVALDTLLLDRTLAARTLTVVVERGSRPTSCWATRQTAEAGPWIVTLLVAVSMEALTWVRRSMPARRSEERLSTMKKGHVTDQD